MNKIANTFIFVLALVLPALCFGQQPFPADVINRARATLGSPEKLDGLVTLHVKGTLEPADPLVPEASLVIFARKPCSQRLEIRVDDMIETTILDGRKGCIVRSNINMEASQMRRLTPAELARVRYTTQQFFNFYRPDFKNGEKIEYEGMMTHRGERVHKLRYFYPDGLETTRFFHVEEDRLVAAISDNGVESINIGEQYIDGIKYPERIDYYENGQKLHTVFLREVEVNKPLPAGIFDIPKPREN